MTETFGAVLGELRDLVTEQVRLWRTLLETTRETAGAMGRQDAPRFEAALERQIETLRALKSLERERARLVRSVGGSFADPETAELRGELRRLAEDVRRASGVTRVALARNAALVETRIGLHRQAGTLPGEPGPFVHRVA